MRAPGDVDVAVLDHEVGRRGAPLDVPGAHPLAGEAALDAGAAERAGHRAVEAPGAAHRHRPGRAAERRHHGGEPLVALLPVAAGDVEGQRRSIAPRGPALQLDVGRRRRDPAGRERDPLGIVGVADGAADRRREHEREARRPAGRRDREALGVDDRRQQGERARQPFLGARLGRRGQRPILQRRRRRDANLAVAAVLAEPAQRPRQQVAPGRPAVEPQAGERARLHQPGDVDVLVGGLEAGDARPHRIAERLHREIDRQLAAVEARARLHHLEAVARPDQRPFHAGEAPVVQARLEAGEAARQLAPALEQVVGAGELARPGERELVARPEQLLHAREVDARAHGVGLLGPARRVDLADGVRHRAVGDQVDALDHDLAAVDPEAAGGPGPHRLEARDLDRRLVEVGGAAVGVRLADRHLEVRRHDRPRRAVVLQLEGPARRLHRADRGDEPLRPLGAVAGELGEVVAAVLEGLDRHVPVGDLDVLDDQVAADDRPPRHVHRDPLGGEERPIALLQPADAEVADDEPSAQQARRQAADVELALEERGAALLRLAAQPRAEVDAEEGDEHDGEDDGGRRQDQTHEPPQAGKAAAGNVGRRVRGRVGQLAGGLGWIHSHTSDAGAGQATPHCSRNTPAFRPVRLTARSRGRARPRGRP